MQVQTFRTDRDTPPKIHEVVVGEEAVGDSVESGRDGVWEPPLLLKIPVVCPSVENCQLIQVEYQARVSYKH